VTGLPWWTFDAGGFFRPGSTQYADPDFHERFLRWFQFSTFCPLQRVHGYQTQTEFWRYGPLVEREARRYLDLRYRLLPYLYTQAADITFHHGTLMRPLVMDFAHDREALAQDDQYMFGPAFLVAPVHAAQAQTWPVYLPQHEPGWINFWTGESLAGGQQVDVPVDVATLPLLVKAGSIVPLGPTLQHSSEKPADTLEIRVYPGADAHFTLYEDEGTNYQYETGAYATIDFTWDQAKQQLTIGPQQGTFPGSLKQRIFQIVWVEPSRGVGISQSKPHVVVPYQGEQVRLTRQR